MADKILIIDDDVDTLKLVGLMLERQGYQITVANNGSQGITKANAERPDLILLDVMMPDMDGYEVTQLLREDPGLAHIPIIMFTAKSMVDDKVAGFEAGVDDYLTKPTHPAELTAHVKAVLARSSQARDAATMPAGKDKAAVIAFLGVRGGLGTSTLAANVAVALQQAGQDVILAELNPGHGTLALDLDVKTPPGLSNLLTRSLKDIHLRSVDAELVDHKSGVRALLSDYHPSELELEQAVPQFEAVLSNLAALSTVVVADLGASVRPYVKPLLELTDRVVVVIEPVHPTDKVAKAVVDDLIDSGYPRHKVNMALLTRTRTSLQIPWKALNETLGIDLAGVVSPAPEQAHQASQSGTPLILIQPDSLIADQLQKVAQYLSKFLQPVKG
jgi:DNA-binding response OmpR family regulator